MSEEHLIFSNINTTKPKYLWHSVILIMMHHVQKVATLTPIVCALSVNTHTQYIDQHLTDSAKNMSHLQLSQKSDYKISNLPQEFQLRMQPQIIPDVFCFSIVDCCEESLSLFLWCCWNREQIEKICKKKKKHIFHHIRLIIKLIHLNWLFKLYFADLV